MCSFTNATGTSMKFFLPCLTKPGTAQKRNYYNTVMYHIRLRLNVAQKCSIMKCTSHFNPYLRILKRNSKPVMSGELILQLRSWTAVEEHI
jgi:hypothetical protein